MNPADSSGDAYCLVPFEHRGLSLTFCWGNRGMFCCVFMFFVG